EDAVTVVKIKNIRLAMLDHQAFGSNLQPLLVFFWNHAPAIDVHCWETSAADRLGPIIHHVNIQVAISVDIRHGERRAAGCLVESGGFAFSEVAFAIIQETARAPAD